MIVLTSVSIDLHGSKHGDVDPARSDHTERLVATKCGSALDQSDSLLPGIDKVRIFLSWLGISTHTENAILGFQDDLNALGKERWGSKRHTDSKVDIHAILELLRGPLDDALTLLRRFGRTCTVLASEQNTMVESSHLQEWPSSAPQGPCSAPSVQSSSPLCS